MMNIKKLTAIGSQWKLYFAIDSVKCARIKILKCKVQFAMMKISKKVVYDEVRLLIGKVFML